VPSDTKHDVALGSTYREEYHIKPESGVKTDEKGILRYLPLGINPQGEWNLHTYCTKQHSVNKHAEGINNKLE